MMVIRLIFLNHRLRTLYNEKYPFIIIRFFVHQLPSNATNLRILRRTIQLKNIIIYRTFYLWHIFLRMKICIIVKSQYFEYFSERRIFASFL